MEKNVFPLTLGCVCVSVLIFVFPGLNIESEVNEWVLNNCLQQPSPSGQLIGIDRLDRISKSHIRMSWGWELRDFQVQEAGILGRCGSFIYFFFKIFFCCCGPFSKSPLLILRLLLGALFFSVFLSTKACGV